MPSFSSAPAAVAYDKNATQPLGAICTGMGYSPDEQITATTAASYIGGAAQSIGYGKGVQAVETESEQPPHKGKAK